jgi:UDP-N-acetylmuramate dehydrogenase
VRGKLTVGAALAPLVWFKTGGAARWLFEPADTDDLCQFLASLDPAIPVIALGLGSNLIIRDGGFPGVVVRLGKAFAKVTVYPPHPQDGEGDHAKHGGGVAAPSPYPSTIPAGWSPSPPQAMGRILHCGAGASGILASSTARDAGIAGMEFLRSIPGTVGGFVRMNGGAYGGEVKDILVDCDVVRRDGTLVTLGVDDLCYSYRHSELPDGAIVVAARFRGRPGEPAAIQAEMDRIAASREASQPLRSKTGGSTFKNPDGHKAWQLVDAAGCRGLTIGGAQVSEKHTNFLINTGTATSADIEALGEDVRRRVRENSGVELQWEIQRVGEA